MPVETVLGLYSSSYLPSRLSLKIILLFLAFGVFHFNENKQINHSLLWWLKASGPSLGHCSGLNKIDPYRLIYLNTYPPVGGIVWEGLGGVALLEEVSHWA